MHLKKDNLQSTELHLTVDESYPYFILRNKHTSENNDYTFNSNKWNIINDDEWSNEWTNWLAKQQWKTIELIEVLMKTL